ncbi:hypothetical protein [Aureimonas sp. AU12]|uniref:hypothetical protein n=1 Tax=Aureimonas sp. AU12 TaxID=1638161 RepID=UPI0007857FD8|nr:hypothetical protein [Aureimonas sp. AU12]
MADQVRLKSLTVFASDRITVFAEGASEGTKGGAVVSGQEFETDLLHARDLVRLGSAEPTNPADLNGEVGPLEAHYSVSASDWKRYQAADDAAAKQIEAIRERVNQVAAEADSDIEGHRLRVEYEREEADRWIERHQARAEEARLQAEDLIASFAVKVDEARSLASPAGASADTVVGGDGGNAEATSPAEGAEPAPVAPAAEPDAATASPKASKKSS